MNLPNDLFIPEKYTYNDYKLWEGNWELINGYPIAMSPSAKYTHQSFSGKFYNKISRVLENNCGEKYNCEVLFELDWVVDEHNTLRPDIIIVCAKIKEDFLTFPPTLAIEVTSFATQMRDRNTKYNIYEACGVKYYIMADPDKKTIEVFELIDNKYKQTTTTHFVLTDQCSIELDVATLWH